MALACVNNVGVSQEFPTYGCFEDPVGMFPADELFSDGKLVKNHQLTVETGEKLEISGSDNCLFSTKASRCSSRWKELLGLMRFSQNSKAASTTIPSNPRSSLKQFLNRSSRSSSSGSFTDASLLSLPLLKDSDLESLSVSSSGISLSSSSSIHDHEDLARLSLDLERPNQNHNHNHNLTAANPFAPARSQNPNPPRMRLMDGGRVGRSTTRRQTAMSRGMSVDSPRLNSSGKIVFESLERSTSSPSSFNGGYRHRGTERSYNSNVRVAPILNVPVCSIRGGSVIFAQFFSSSSSSQHNRTVSNNRASSHYVTISRGRNSTDRI